ncbi:MAG: glucuronate isomerase [Clostridiales bacterium]|nr:glucuronate isomerase [Clostridiales bacterium]
MQSFMDADFLLDTPCAKKLFHDVAEHMPICDYHCHLSPKEIYENRPPADISELWLSGDHYKWRAMRSCGISEDYCTGSKSGREKFEKFAYTLQYAIGNPLYHWAHLELKKYFGVDTPLNAQTADEVYDRANAAIASGDFRPRTLIQKSNVKVICTTDDPVDSLEYHRLLQELPDFDCRVLPTFRPDKALGVQQNGFASYAAQLGAVCGFEIKTTDDMIQALLLRIDHFHSLGCRLSDHAFDCPPYAEPLESAADERAHTDIVLQKALRGERVTDAEADRYRLAVMQAIGARYHQLGWTMAIHIGAMRNNNSRMFARLGPDTGFDSIGDREIAYSLSRFLDSLDKNGNLPKTILFNLNAKDNDVLATMLGNFQGTEAESKIQYGPAWWFLDTIDGMTAQLKTLGNLGILGKFVGMETDSRSFTSYARHDYFRRILCRVIGRWVENGWFENNEPLLEEIVRGICFDNAMRYFQFEK